MIDKVFEVLEKTLSTPAKEWLVDQTNSIANLRGTKALFLAFSLVSRQPNANQEIEFDGSIWNQEALSRLYILLKFQESHPADEVIRTISLMADTSDINEEICLNKSYQYLTTPEAYLAKVRESCRTNVVPIFESVAHGNPYPVRYFDEEGWNQLILKALFVDSTLRPILSYKDRFNADLQIMLIHFAEERMAADRPLPADWWYAQVDKAGHPDVQKIALNIHDRLSESEKADVRQALLAAGSPISEELKQLYTV